MLPFLERLIGKPKVRHFVALDVGSNTAIRSLLFDADPVECVAIEKRQIELPARERESDLIPMIGGELHRILSGYIRRIGRVPDATLIGLGNHFTFNETAVASKNRSDPDAPIRAGELSAVFSSFRQEHRERIVSGARYRLVHLMPFRIRVDGYPLEALSSRSRGRRIEIPLFATYAKLDYCSSLSSLRAVLGGVRSAFISNQAALAATLMTYFALDEALIIKIGAKITELSLIGQGAILITGQFDRGGDDVTRAIARALGVDQKSAERIKCQWGHTRLPERAHDAVSAAVAGEAERWLEAFSHFLRQHRRPLLPSQVFLVGGGARLAAIRRLLGTRPWHRGLTIHEALHVQVLDAARISRRIFRNTQPPLGGTEEVALAAIAGRLIQQYL